MSKEFFGACETTCKGLEFEEGNSHSDSNERKETQQKAKHDARKVFENAITPSCTVVNSVAFL
jgi:hypothetical protein